MAHLGKFYPTYNPGRVLLIDTPWQFPMPTEYNWQCDIWRGAIANGAPNGGRGLLPTGYDPTTGTVVYTKTLTGTLGPPFVIVLTFTQADPGYYLYGDLRIFVGAVNQISAATSDLTNSALDILMWGGGSSYNYFPITGSTAYPANYLQFRARKWTDAPPPPPATSPY